MDIDLYNRLLEVTGDEKLSEGIAFRVSNPPDTSTSGMVFTMMLSRGYQLGGEKFSKIIRPYLRSS